MPFELGLDVGCRFFGKGRWKQKKCLVLETERISISGGYIGSREFGYRRSWKPTGQGAGGGTQLAEYGGWTTRSGPDAVLGAFHQFHGRELPHAEGARIFRPGHSSPAHRRTDRRHVALGRGAPGMIPTLADIRDAAGLIAGVVLRTPFLPAPRLSALTGASSSSSTRTCRRPPPSRNAARWSNSCRCRRRERERGVVAMSAGNHAQAVAYHAAAPRHPRDHRHAAADAVREGGGDARFRRDGDPRGRDAGRVADAVAPDRERDRRRPRPSLRRPGGDPRPGHRRPRNRRRRADLDAWWCRSAAAGSSPASPSRSRRSPRRRASSASRPSSTRRSGRPSALPARCGGDSLAEGIAVKKSGRSRSRSRAALVDDIVLVAESAIERAVADYLMLQKTMAEGAGAAGLAAVLADPDRFRGKRVGLILAGGNIDPRLAASIMVRELARERTHRRRPHPHQRPARRARRHRRDHRRAGGNILEVLHHRTMLDVPPKGASVDVTVETHGPGTPPRSSRR